MQYLNTLQRWYRGNIPTSEELTDLFNSELANYPQACSFAVPRGSAFDLNPDNGLAHIEVRSQLFQAVHSDIVNLCQNLGFKQVDYILSLLWRLWLPLAMQLASAQKNLGRPLIQGILGGQGTGKTTLAEVLKLILKHLDCDTVEISIDDLYKTKIERETLKKFDSRLKWRGPPITHDVDLGILVLDKALQANRTEPVLIPRFDKSTDDRKKELDSYDKVDIVLLEGWFVGARPVDDTVFDNPPPPIVSEADKQFAKDNNERLKAYLRLWERLDRLLVLYPVDYRLSVQWRSEAEHKMIASGRAGMSDSEIEEFVNYFWRSLHPELFITPLTQNPDLTDLVIEINPDHSPGNVYKP